MKASNDQLNRVKELARRGLVDGRALWRAVGKPLADMATEEASTVTAVLTRYAGEPPEEILERIRFALNRNPRQEESADTATTSATPDIIAEPSWQEQVANLLGYDTGLIDCDHCGGSGTTQSPIPPDGSLLKELLSPDSQSPLATMTAAKTLRSPSWEKLQLLATHFDGDLNATVEFAATIADLIEADA